MTELIVGVVGYSAQKFDTTEADHMIKETYDQVASANPDREIVIVSGLTDLGIPALAYREASARGWRTVGVACAKARDYDCYPVDQEVIVGDNWGDESATFLEMLDVMIRIGGGKQAHAEAEQLRATGKPVIERDLAATPA